jgi:hypothetical protein
MTIVNWEDAARDGVAFWTRQLGAMTPELQSWLEERIEDVHLLWGDIQRLNRTKDMWGELTEVLEARDPTNPWTRNYDALYFEAQIMRLTRVFSGQISLVTILKDFERRPELCRKLTARLTPDSLREAVGPAQDRQRLGKLLAPVDYWRDKRIAHIDRERTLADVRLPDLGPMVDGVSEVFGRYASRLAGAEYGVTFPKRPPWTDWKQAFTVPIFDS